MIHAGLNVVTPAHEHVRLHSDRAVTRGTAQPLNQPRTGRIGSVPPFFVDPVRDAIQRLGHAARVGAGAIVVVPLHHDHRGLGGFDGGLQLHVSLQQLAMRQVKYVR